ncbi:MAG: Tryptophan--tRNA ligase 2 [Chlamydiae bacterium]|nr:Tryptophan--tRNA ligase 2 [Chlamydiota bacterium]
MSKKEVILTGDRPTGRLHLGHYIGSLKNRVALQDIHTQFVMVADIQALTDHAKEPSKVTQSVKEVMLDYLSCGLDPKKTTMLLQSQIPALAELTIYYLNLVTINRLKHNPTVKSEIDQKGFKEGVPAGFVIYPISQAADITAFKATLIPVGADQLPMIEQTNEIVRSFNRIYGNTLVECKGLVTSFSRLVGTDGAQKMSKTLGNAIFLSDSPEEIEKKVKKMYTDPNHLRVEDPGKVEGNPVFTYLDAFARDKNKVDELKAHYQKGGLGDSVVKKYLLEELLALLEPIQKRRKELEDDLGYVFEVLDIGTQKANEIAQNTLDEVKAAIGLDYSLSSSIS